MGKASRRRRNYDKETLLLAMKMVVFDNMTVSKASKVTGVPRSSLMRAIERAERGAPVFPTLGRPTMLEPAVERTIGDVVESFQKSGRPTDVPFISRIVRNKVLEEKRGGRLRGKYSNAQGSQQFIKRLLHRREMAAKDSAEVRLFALTLASALKSRLLSSYYSCLQCSKYPLKDDVIEFFEDMDAILNGTYVKPDGSLLGSVPLTCIFNADETPVCLIVLVLTMMIHHLGCTPSFGRHRWTRAVLVNKF